MSEIVLAVLEMPDDLFWVDDTMSRHQHDQVRKEAAKEIRENRARIAELESLVESCTARNVADVDRIAELKRKNAGLQASEDRYRFIRERISVTELQLILGRKPDPEPAYEVEIDAVVDAAMSK